MKGRAKYGMKYGSSLRLEHSLSRKCNSVFIQEYATVRWLVASEEREDGDFEKFSGC